MRIEPTDLPEVLLITPMRHGDARGWFSETFRADRFAEAAPDVTFVQDNHAMSARAGVVRGLHFQAPPHAQGKLVRCVRGRIRDIAVDIREGSPGYGRHVAVDLDPDGGRQLYVPAGFAHGYAVLEAPCEVLYKTTAYYAPDHEGGLAWDDPALAIDWGVAPEAAVLAPRDRDWPRLACLATPFCFGA